MKIMPLIFWNFYTQQMQKHDVKKFRQNIVFVEQQIYTSQENFTPTVLVVIVTFRRSVE